MDEEQLKHLCEIHPGLAEGLCLLRMAGVSWEDIVQGLQEFMRQYRQTLN
jgi:hypothetical protein